MVDDKKEGNIIVRAFREFGEDECPRMAAALSYYVVFSLPPLLVLILLVAGFFMSSQEAEAFIQGQLSPDAADQVGTMISSASERLSGGGALALILGLGGLIFSATGAFAQLQKALNTAWEVEPDPNESGGSKIKHLVMKRLLSLGMIASMAFLLVVALALSGIISAFTDQIAEWLAPLGVSPGAAGVLAWTTDALFSTALVTLIFAALFKVLPDVRVRWKDIWFGAFVTAILFVIGKMAIGYYIGQSNPGEAFGAAGALAAIMIFVYYSAMILLFGAEFTQIWARQKGQEIRPGKHAVRVVEEKRYPDQSASDEQAQRNDTSQTSPSRTPGH